MWVRRAVMVAAVAACAAAYLQAQAPPAKYALIVGVGSYAAPSIHHLEGPPNDAASVARELTTRWGFPAANVRTLVDAQATRANILAGLDWLVATSKPGDQVVFFYSGHGTSRQDRNSLHYGLHPDTGAIFPYDVVVSSEERAMDTLLIGRRDIRPRLEQLDRGRNVLVIFDSCYSQNAGREGPPFGYRAKTNKAQPLFGGELQGFLSPIERQESFPYENTVTISAAAENQQALDITAEDILNGVRTIDGRPKGALTDAFLRALRGDANTNNDQTLTIDELFKFVETDVTKRFQHTPQLGIAKSGSDPGAAPLFGMRSAPPRVLSAAQTFRVRTDNAPPAIVRRVSAMSGVGLVTSDDYDLRLTVQGSELLLVHRSGDRLQALPLTNADAIVDRVSRQRAAHEIVNLELPEQDFNIKVDIPTTTGTLKAKLDGQPMKYRLDYSVDVPAVVVILNIDKEGYVSVLHPQSRRDMRPERKWSISGIEVTKPDGAEFVKAFAFRTAPDWLPTAESLGLVPADSAKIAELIARVRALRSGVAETQLKIVTDAS